MNGARDQLLSSAALAADEHCGARGGRLTDELVDLDHPLVAADEKVAGRCIGLAVRRGALPQESVLKDARHHLTQFGETDRLDEELDGAAAHGGNDGRHVVEGGHENDVDLGGALTQQVLEREPADVGHAHVGEHYIRPRVLEHGERAGAVFRDADGDPVIGQRLGQRSADDGIVVDDEDASGHGLRL